VAPAEWATHWTVEGLALPGVQPAFCGLLSRFAREPSCVGRVGSPAELDSCLVAVAPKAGPLKHRLPVAEQLVPVRRISCRRYQAPVLGSAHLLPALPSTPCRCRAPLVDSAHLRRLLLEGRSASGGCCVRGARRVAVRAETRLGTSSRVPAGRARLISRTRETADPGCTRGYCAQSS